MSTNAYGQGEHICAAYISATHAEAHLAHGCFNSERILLMLNRAVEEALDQGFSALRTCGDMSWLLAKPDGVEQVIEYEGLLNQFFLGTRAAGMCQYDRRRLPAPWVHHALHTHPTVIVDGLHGPNEFFNASPLPPATDLSTSALAGKLTRLRHRP